VLDVIDPLARAASMLVCGMLGAPAVIAGLILLGRRKRAFQLLDARPVLDDSLPLHAPVVRGVTLYTSSGVDVPLALTRRRICLPDAGFAELGRAEQESVLLHELAHIDRHDPSWAEAARVLVCVAWWQPLNRVLVRRMERDAELAADARAVERGAVPTALVSALASFANRLESGLGVAGVPLARSDSPLVERARLLLAGPAPRHHARVAATMALATLLAVGSIIVLPIPTTSGPIGRPNQVQDDDVREESAARDVDVDLVRTSVR
jgi:beta-lactamase regulating signal transducer with metallopeptidase domain